MRRGHLWPLVVLAALTVPHRSLAQVIRLGAELQVNAYTTGRQYLPSVAISASGDFVVAWDTAGQDGSYRGIFARRFSSNGPPLTDEIQVNSFTIGLQTNPSVTSDSNGNFVVAWASGSQDGDSNGVFVRRFSSVGTPLAGEIQVNAYTTGGQSGPSVAASASGGFVVAWESSGQDGGSGGIFARRLSSDGTPLANELQVNAYTTGIQRRVSVAADDAGSFVVAWESSGQDGDSGGIFARRFSSDGTPLADELQVNSYTTGNQYLTSVAASATGDFVVAWQSNGPATVFSGQDGESGGVFARRFSSAGTPLADEFQANTYTTGNQYGPSVAADADGDFVVAWSGAGQDGDSAGVFAQRFAAPKVLDIDANGSVAALTDGLLVLRYLFGFTGATLANGAVDLAGCNRCSAEAIEDYLATLI